MTNALVFVVQHLVLLLDTRYSKEKQKMFKQFIEVQTGNTTCMLRGHSSNPLMPNGL